MQLAKHLLRSGLAVIAGYLVTGLLTVAAVPAVGALFPASLQPENTGWVLVNVLYGCLFAVAGGYVTAWLAPAQPLRHALVLGGLMAVLAVLTGLAVAATPPSPDYAAQPGWYYPVLAVTVLPCVALGGWLRARQTGGRLTRA